MQVPVKERIPRGFELALAATAILWTLAAGSIAGHSAQGIARRFNAPAIQALLTGLFSIFLLVFGFQLLDWIATRGGNLMEALPLPRRLGWPQEWGIGAALGWGLGLVVVLPLLFSGNLHGHIGLAARHPGGFLLTILTLLVVVLAEEIVFRGYILIRLIAALGPTWAAVVTSLGFAVTLVWADPPASPLLGLLDGALFGLVLAMAYLRTHGLWLGWGIHFAYRAVILLLIGLPAAGHISTWSVMDTFATGPLWLTGDGYGVDDALLTAFLLLGAMAVLFRCTREYAWNYTYRPIVGAGYEVAVPPPKAHAAMAEQAAPAPLVQILSTTSQSPTVPPPPRP